MTAYLVRIVRLLDAISTSDPTRDGDDQTYNVSA